MKDGYTIPIALICNLHLCMTHVVISLLDSTMSDRNAVLVGKKERNYLLFPVGISFVRGEIFD